MTADVAEYEYSHGRHDTLPLRTRRLAKAAAAISLASAPLICCSLPALASPAGRAASVHPGLAASHARAADTPAPVPAYEWWLRTLHVVRAWGADDGRGTTVAVLSDGVVTTERYLAASVITGPDFTRSGRTVRSPYFGVMGTSLASLVAGHGMGDYGQGTGRFVRGVAPGAKILSIRVTLSPGDPLWSNSRITSALPAAIASGIRYAVGHGASVIELPTDPGVRDAAIASGSAAAAGGSPAERAAVRYALAQNVLLVAPAGDDGQAGGGANYPAAYPGVIAVGAFGRTFVKSPYSSRQPYVSLTAAGQGVVAANRAGFYRLNSTCAAGAIVAGIASLIRSEFPDLDVTQVRDSLTESTRYHPPGGMRSGSGHGTVDAYRAIETAATMSPPHARPAMQGARPHRRPAPPAVRSSLSILTRELTGDAVIAGAALLILLIPIVLYGSFTRRRERRETASAAVQSTERAAVRSGHGTMVADPLLEFFGPQHARPTAPPAVARSAAAPRFQPRPGLTGRSTMSSALGARPHDPAAPALSSAWATAPIEPAATQPAPSRGAAARPVLPVRVASVRRPSQPGPAEQPAAAPAAAPAPAAGTQAAALPSASGQVRRTPVTGEPPWEPASQPTSDLPWAAIANQPGPGRPAGAEPPAIPPPPDSVWDSTLVRQSSPPGSLFQSAPPPPGRRSDGSPPLPGPRRELPAAESARPARTRPDLDADAERGPIFSWNPTEATDQFTAIDPASTDWGRATGEFGRD